MGSLLDSSTITLKPLGCLVFKEQSEFSRYSMLSMSDTTADLTYSKMRRQPGSTTGHHHWLESSNESSKKHTILKNAKMVWLAGSSIPRSSKCGLKKRDRHCGAQECVCLDSAFPFSRFCLCMSRFHAIPNLSLGDISLWVILGLLANLGYRRYWEVHSHVRTPPKFQISNLI